MATPKKKLYDRYLGRVKPLLSTPLSDDIIKAFEEGKTSVLRMSRYESSAFDTSWVDVIEDVLFDLGEIIKAPRTITKEEGSLVPVELAKKTTSESVQHLASHTQYVKNIDDDGSVVPSKIMSFGNDDFLYTYENRFIATFIRRLVLFVEKRYEFIQAYIPLHREEVMMIKTKAVINGEEVEIETKIKSKSEENDQSAVNANAIAERIRAMREYILYYYGSPFMKKMKNERDVRKPILMTNILRKNLKYHKCFEVFQFIERYDSFGLDYKSEDVYSELSADQIKDLALLTYGQYLALQDDREYETIKTRGRAYKPKILTSIDDEEFLFGPIVKGPIEFVRVDEEYRRYLDSKVRNDLPLRPKKQEKGYYYDEYGVKYEVKEDQRQIDKLLRRKEKSLRDFEKALLKIIAKRDEEDALMLSLEDQERLEEEERRLAIKRAEIVSSAQNGIDPAAALEERRAALLAASKEEAKQAGSVEEEPNENEPEQPMETNLSDAQEESAETDNLAQEAAVEEENGEPVIASSEESEPVIEESPSIQENEGETKQDDRSLSALEEKPLTSEDSQRSTVESAVESSEAVMGQGEPTDEPAITSSKPKKRFRVRKPQTKEPEKAIGGEEPITEEPAAQEAPFLVNEGVLGKGEEPKEDVIENAEEPEKVILSNDGEARPILGEKEPKKAKNNGKTGTKSAKKPRKVKPVEVVEDQAEAVPSNASNDTVFAVIPGKFIVKAPEGYYISDTSFTKAKSKATIFYDFNQALLRKKRFGGKVVKL